MTNKLTTKEIKTKDDPWLDLGLVVGKRDQKCPVHGKTTLEVKRMDSGVVVFKCWNPSCPAHAGGTIVQMRLLTRQSDDEEQAIRDLLVEYGKLSEGEATLRAQAEGGRQDGMARALLKSKPRGAAQVEPPTYFYDESGARHTDQGVTYTVGGREIWESYALSDATYAWVASGMYAGQVWAIAVMRWDIVKPDGQPDKIVRPYTKNPKGTWLSGIKHIEVRPLYRLLDIELSPKATVIVVEGEKCMDALRQHIDDMAVTDDTLLDYLVTTSIGGSGNAEKTDWSLLNGRHVIVCPDSDKAGLKYARHIAQLLPDSQVEVVWVDEARGQGEGRDIADWLKDNPGKSFFELKREPMNWSALVEEIKERCSKARLDNADDILREIINDFKPAPFLMEDMIKRMSKALDLTPATVRARIRALMSERAPQGWAKFFAERVIEEEFSGHLLREGEQWWMYNGRKWGRVSYEEQITSAVNRCMERHWPTAIESWPATLKASRELLAATCASMELRLPIYEAPPAIINAVNGELILKREGGFDMRPHSPDHFLLHSINARYEPKATCPEYDRMVLDLFMGDEQMVAFWHEVAGYLIQPDRWLKHFFMFQGGGNNGKTSLIRVISRLAEGSVAYSDVNDLTQRFGLNNLVGKLFMVDDDVSSGTKLPDGPMKKLSEGKNFDVEYKGKERLPVWMVATPILLCNKWPSLSDVTEATLSRALVLPFRAEITRDKRDPFLVQRIVRDELSGVLNRCLQGLDRLKARGHFDPPNAARECHAEWLAGSNHGTAFCLTMISGSRGREARESEELGPTANEIYQHYERYCEDESIDRGRRYSKPALKNILEGIGFKTKSTSRKYGAWRLLDAKFNSHDE